MAFARDEIALIVGSPVPYTCLVLSQVGAGGLSHPPTLSSCGTESRAHPIVIMIWGAAAPSLGPAQDMEGDSECWCWFLCSW